ncbi:hypothetical protein J2X04_000650 [Lysobacter niabensis]|uniref:Uncharacterized protein n=1 Tax=Agrilutibacter niabensis TaxID=380628 RepID=A0ABU1VM08_9GAMM|nr:hypothetical protein [Lysobacter niabensis]MDR7098303.1 hypothetical protein [Lysobacter niabensis]
MKILRLDSGSAQKLLLLVVTAAPGVQRLAFISALSFMLATTDVGIAAADIGIASFLALLAGGAASGQLMAIWARFPDPAIRREMTRNALVWQLCIVPVAVVAALAMDAFGLVGSVGAVIAFFAGFSLWQVERTKLLSDRKLLLLGVFEMLLIVVVASFAFLCSASAAVISYGVALLAAGAVALLVSWSADRGGGGRPEGGGMTYRETAMLAANGVVSTGREQLTTPAVLLISGGAMAGVVAQVSSVVAALLLLPRALANNYVPELSRHADSPARTGEILVRYRQAMRYGIMGISGALLILVFCAWCAGTQGTTLVIALLAGLSLIAGQLALLPSTVLTVRRATAPILMTALYVTVAWLAVVGVLFLVELRGALSVALLLIFTTVAVLLRGVILSRAIERPSCAPALREVR